MIARILWDIMGQSAKPDPLTSSGEEKPACPRCHQFQIYRRTNYAAERGKWFCENCVNQFDDPHYLIPKHTISATRPHLSAAGQAALDWNDK